MGSEYTLVIIVLYKKILYCTGCPGSETRCYKKHYYFSKGTQRQ